MGKKGCKPNEHTKFFNSSFTHHKKGYKPQRIKNERHKKMDHKPEPVTHIPEPACAQALSIHPFALLPMFLIMATANMGKGNKMPEAHKARAKDSKEHVRKVANEKFLGP